MIVERGVMAGFVVVWCGFRGGTPNLKQYITDAAITQIFGRDDN